MSGRLAKEEEKKRDEALKEEEDEPEMGYLNIYLCWIKSLHILKKWTQTLNYLQELNRWHTMGLYYIVQVMKRRKKKNNSGIASVFLKIKSKNKITHWRRDQPDNIDDPQLITSD